MLLYPCGHTYTYPCIEGDGPFVTIRRSCKVQVRNEPEKVQSLDSGPSISIHPFTTSGFSHGLKWYQSLEAITGRLEAIAIKSPKTLDFRSKTLSGSPNPKALGVLSPSSRAPGVRVPERPRSGGTGSFLVPQHGGVTQRVYLLYLEYYWEILEV